MKKILFLMALVLASCTVETDKTNGRNPDSATVYEVAPTQVYQFTFHGHKYIGFGTHKAYTHDPDCPCQVKLREQVDSILTRMYD